MKQYSVSASCLTVVEDIAHWADRKEIYMSCDFKDFSPRKGFLCKEYFKML